MQKLRLFAFNARLVAQALVCWLISLFTKKLGKKYREHKIRGIEAFGIKSIHNGWTEVLDKRFDSFKTSQKFRRELFISSIDNAIVLRALQGDFKLNAEEIKLVATVRAFADIETSELLEFKQMLLASSIPHKLDVVKLFYKNTEQGEPNSQLASRLVGMYAKDHDFIFWLAVRGSANELKMKFLENVLSCDNNENKGRLEEFVGVGGFANMSFKFNIQSSLVVNMREYLKRAEDIALWEEYLFEHEDRSSIICNINCYGILSSKGIQQLLKLNDYELIDAYNNWKKD